MKAHLKRKSSHEPGSQFLSSFSYAFAESLRTPHVRAGTNTPPHQSFPRRARPRPADPPPSRVCSQQRKQDLCCIAARTRSWETPMSAGRCSHCRLGSVSQVRDPRSQLRSRPVLSPSEGCAVPGSQAGLSPCMHSGKAITFMLTAGEKLKLINLAAGKCSLTYCLIIALVELPVTSSQELCVSFKGSEEPLFFDPKGTLRTRWNYRRC